jgi:GTP-binding protein Era
VAIIGRPNAGKSTLLNRLLDYQLSAVSPKPQTTRHSILGVVTGEGFQAAFYDTPGLPYRTSDQLDRRLVAAALEALQGVDLVLMLAEARPPGDVEQRIIEELRKDGKRAILALNKVDRVKKETILPAIEAYSKAYPFLEIIPISALTGDGVAEMLGLVAQHLPEGEAEYPQDEMTDRSERFLASEMVREQVFNAYAAEVPYAVAVELEDFQEASEEHGGKDYISATLFVEKDSQKAILIGRGGLMLKTIGTAARERIEEMLGRPVHLELWVKVQPKWRKDKGFLERVGY